MSTPGFQEFFDAVHRHEQAFAFWRLRGRPRGGQQRQATLIRAAEAAWEQLQKAWAARSAALDAEPDPAVGLAGQQEIVLEMQRAGALLAEVQRGGASFN